MHVRPIGPARRSWVSLFLLISMLSSMVPAASASTRVSAATPAVPAALPILRAPTPLGTAALSRMPRGLSDLRAAVERDTSVQVEWMSDQAYDIEVEYGLTSALGQRTRPAKINRQQLANGGYINTLTLPARADLGFYRLRAMEPGTRRTATLSAIQQLGQANAPTAQMDHSAHQHHAMQGQAAPVAAAVQPRTEAFQTTTSGNPGLNSSQVYCEYGGVGGGPLFVPRPPCASTPSEADPVSTGDGAWYMNVPCLTLGGAGLPISIGLRYSTHMWFDSIGMSSIGTGWTVGYSRRLSFTNLTADYYTPTPSLMLTLETGERWPFYAAGNGTYTNGPGNYTSLVYNATTTEYTLTYRNGMKDIFAADGLLKRVEDRFGNQTLISPISAVGVITITNARTGQAILLEHEQRTENSQTLWKLVRIKDGPSNGGTARLISLTYNTSGQLTKVTDAAGRVRTFAYDANGRIDTYYDPNNDPAVVAAPKFMRNVYETNGFNHRVRTQTLPSGATVEFSFAYGAPIGKVTITYNKGLADQRVLSYDMYTRANGGLAGRITRATMPNSSSATVMSYDNNGNLEWVTDALGRRTRYVYDTRGDLREVHAYKDATTYDATLLEYNSFGQMTKLIEPAGAVTEWTYDATTGAPLTIVRRATLSGVAVAQTTTVETNPITINGVAVRTGLVTGVRLPDGTWNTQAYDSRGHPTVTTYDANYGGNTGRLALSASTVFDWRGFLTSSSDLQGITTSYEYGQDPATGKFGNLGWPSATVLDTAAGGRAVRSEYTYDRAGNLVKEIRDAGTGRRNAVWQYSYAPVGLYGGYDISQLTNPLNQITRYSYTSYGNLKQLTEVNPRAGQTERNTVFDYTTEGWLKQVRLHDSRVAETYAYNLLGETVAMTDAAGVVTSQDYDAKGRLSFTSDQFRPESNLARGKTPTQSSTWSSSTANYAVDGNRGSIAWTNSQAQPSWDLDLGAAYDLSTIHVYGDAYYTSNVYVFVSNTPFTSADPNVTRTQAGVSTTYIEGAIGSPSPVPLNRTGRYVRVQMGGSGYLGLYEVEVYGRAPLSASAQLTRYTYDANDRPTQATTRVTGTTTRTVFERSYDGFNRLQWERDGGGNQTTYSYDNTRDWMTLATTGSNNAAEQVQTQYGYDKLGRLTQQIVDPGAGRRNLITNQFYTAPGSTDRWHLQRIQDPRGALTTHRYNSLGLLAQTVDAQATPGVWTYEYDNLGAATRITPPTGAATTFVPDLLARTASLSRNGQTESWIYNADGTVASQTDFATQITTYGYDTTGRLTSLDRPGTNADATFAYTANDLLQSATSKPDGVTDETTTYSYDPRKRLQSRARDGRTVSYGYNLDNTLQRLTYWTRGDVTYSYNNAAQATAVNPWAAGATAYTYRSTGQLRDATRPTANGIKTTYGYDTAGRLTGVQHLKGTAAINTIQYALDANGNAIQQTDANGTTIYQYDVLNRLTQAQYPPVSGAAPAAVEHLRYDAVGNRIARSGALGGRWQLEGNATDTSGNANNGVVTGAVGASGRVGGALSFDGVDDVVQVPHSPSTTLGQNGADFSVTFWLNPRQGPTGVFRAVMHKGNADTDRTLGMWLGPNDTKLYFAISTTTNWNTYTTTTDLPLNTWTHVAYVKSGTQVKLYLNGVLNVTLPFTGAVLSNTGPLYIGKDPWYAGTNGLFDEVEIIQKALTDAEVEALVGGATRAARWSLDNNSLDTSGNANTATVTGAVATTGKVGGALSFDGVDDVVQVPHSASTAVGQNGADFSVSFWMNLRQGPTGAWRAVLHKGSVNTERTPGLWLNQNDNKLYFNTTTTGFWSDGGTSTVDVPLNTWTHIAYVKAGTQLKLYLNGTLNATVNLTGTVIGNTGPLYIGKDPWHAGMNGLLDEIEVYQKALTDAEVRSAIVRTDYLTSYDASDRVAVGQGVTYDANGNLTQDASGTTYAYDAANRLIRTVKAGVTTEYFYDALGNLIRQRVNGSATTYILNEVGGLPQVLGEMRADASETLYAYGPGGLAARRDVTATGAVLTSYPLLDGIGSVRHWTSAADGSVQQSISYDAWGVIRAVAGANPAGGAGLRNGLGFTGEQQRDDGTVHLRARVYHPQLGRFLQRDSFPGFIQRPQSLNRYSYAEGNPANYTDPSGHFAITLGGLALVAGAVLTAPVSAPVTAVSIIGAAVIGGGIGLYLNRPQGSGPATALPPTPTPSPSPSPSPSPTPTPPPSPMPSPAPVPTPTPTPPCPPPPPTIRMVADSNIFMDRVEGGPAQRARADAILANPNIELLVPPAVDAELAMSPSPTQIARRAGIPGGARITSVPNGDLSYIPPAQLAPPGTPGTMLSRKFGLSDATIIQTAKDQGVPLLSTNEAMRRQVNSDPVRRGYFGPQVDTMVVP